MQLRAVAPFTGAWIEITKLTKVSTREIMYNLFMRNSNDKKLSTKINMIMDNHPDWKKGVFRIGGKNTKGFVRLENYEKSNR